MNGIELKGRKRIKVELLGKGEIQKMSKMSDRKKGGEKP